MGNYDFALFTGHGQINGGGYDGGAINGTYVEHEIASKIVAEAKKYLDKTGKSILYGVNNYKNYCLNGHSIAAKCALSVHLNSVGNKEVTGTEVWVPAKETYLQADFELVEKVSGILKTNNRSVRSKNFDTDNWLYRTNGVAQNYTDWMGEIRDAWQRGIALSLLEVGFISNDGEAPNVVRNIAAIGKAVAEYCCKCMGVECPVIDSPITNREALYNDMKQKYENLLVETNTLRGKIQSVKDIVR